MWPGHVVLSPTLKPVLNIGTVSRVKIVLPSFSTFACKRKLDIASTPAQAKARHRVDDCELYAINEHLPLCSQSPEVPLQNWRYKEHRKKEMAKGPPGATPWTRTNCPNDYFISICHSRIQPLSVKLLQKPTELSELQMFSDYAWRPDCSGQCTTDTETLRRLCTSSSEKLKIDSVIDKLIPQTQLSYLLDTQNSCFLSNYRLGQITCSSIVTISLLLPAKKSYLIDHLTVILKANATSQATSNIHNDPIVQGIKNVGAIRRVPVEPFVIFAPHSYLSGKCSSQSSAIVSDPYSVTMALPLICDGNLITATVPLSASDRAEKTNEQFRNGEAVTNVPLLRLDAEYGWNDHYLTPSGEPLYSGVCRSNKIENVTVAIGCIIIALRHLSLKSVDSESRTITVCIS